MEEKTALKILTGTRKVMAIGGSLAIVIPKEFVDAHNIKEDDYLAFVISENDLNYHLT